MQHDEEYLATAGPEVFVEAHADAAEMCRKYHEHMKAKEVEADKKVMNSIRSLWCVNCNYAFKGSMMCKCQMRITAEMRDAILRKHNRQMAIFNFNATEK